MTSSPKTRSHKRSAVLHFNFYEMYKSDSLEITLMSGKKTTLIILGNFNAINRKSRYSGHMIQCAQRSMAKNNATNKKMKIGNINYDMMYIRHAHQADN